MDLYVPPQLRGEVTVTEVDADGVSQVLGTQLNQIQATWGAIAAECLGRGNRNFRINAMYLEFENLANPATVVTAPTYTRDEGLEYFQSLESSSVRDYLRVPLLLPAGIDIAGDFPEAFTEGQTGNRLTFFSQSQGVAGVHGKTFSEGVNSKIFGVALVATPVFSDPTQDIVFSRTYLDGSLQGVKQASKSLGITWRILFG